jgi:hypothetical protein
MTPPNPAEIFDVLIVILIPGIVLITVTWLVERRMDAPVDKVQRFGQRIPTTERQLLGDDWFEPVRPYFRRRWEAHLRTRLAIAATCGADPAHKKGVAPVRVAGSMNTRRNPDVDHK